MKATITDVAREAGVSAATVSNVLSGKGKITEETRHAVIDAINKLGYRRRRSASRNNEERKKFIGLIAYADFPFQWWFMRDFILATKELMMDEGYCTLYFHCNESTDTQELFDQVMDADLEGLLILHLNDHEFFSKLKSQNIPFVLLNNSNYQSEFPTVCADDFQGAYQGTRQILEMGHRDIIYLEYNRVHQPSTVLDRFFGFRKALEEAGIPFEEERRIQVDLDDESSLQLKLKKVLSNDEDITACFIHDDYFAVRVINALEKLGCKVPDDISVIAPGDTLPYDEPFIPAISTMQIDRRAMSEQAVNMVLSFMDNPEQPLQVIKTLEQFVDRGSCQKIKL